MADHVATIRERIDAALCRCREWNRMLLSGECPVHGENDGNEAAYAALDAVERELADLRENFKRNLRPATEELRAELADLRAENERLGNIAEEWAVKAGKLAAKHTRRGAVACAR